MLSLLNTIHTISIVHPFPYWLSLLALFLVVSMALI
jgi:hypothetical protein